MVSLSMGPCSFSPLWATTCRFLACRSFRNACLSGVGPAGARGKMVYQCASVRDNQCFSLRAILMHRDSLEAIQFALDQGIKCYVEKYPLEKAEEAYES